MKQVDKLKKEIEEIEAKASLIEEDYEALFNLLAEAYNTRGDIIVLLESSMSTPDELVEANVQLIELTASIEEYKKVNSKVTKTLEAITALVNAK